MENAKKPPSKRKAQAQIDARMLERLAKLYEPTPAKDRPPDLVTVMPDRAAGLRLALRRGARAIRAQARSKGWD